MTLAKASALTCVVDVKIKNIIISFADATFNEEIIKINFLR